MKNWMRGLWILGFAIFLFEGLVTRTFCVVARAGQELTKPAIKFTLAPGQQVSLDSGEGCSSIPVWTTAIVGQRASAPPLTNQNGTKALAIPVSTATNVLMSAAGIPARYTAPDRGEPVYYLVDADYLPAGITQAQALQAVSNALGAWSAVTSVKFAFQGIQSFGKASPNVTNLDGILRIQLHDFYNYLAPGLGVTNFPGLGGRYYFTNTVTNASWTLGGNVRGNDFFLTAASYIVIQHTNAQMSDITNLSENLCHQIGHALGLAHSSNDENETNSTLRQAIMYVAPHWNGRGATLGTYDQSVIQQINPSNNLPPYMYPRWMHVVTYPTNAPITNALVNTIQLRGYSVEGKTLNIVTNLPSTNDGFFSYSAISHNLSYTPSTFWPDTIYSPAGNTYFDGIYARCTDGTNASPYIQVRVTSFGADSYSEGIPNSWRATYFGNSNPNAGLNGHATNDADGDGFNNLTEFQLGSNPDDPLSNLRITNNAAGSFHWQAMPYELYEIFASTNLTNWQRVTNPILATNSSGFVSFSTNGFGFRCFRVARVP